MNTNDLSQLFQKLTQNRTMHAQFINTLSLLEYIGARKILKSQNEQTVDAELLSHMAEEIRHAQALKKVALKLSEGSLTHYSEDQLVCGQEARSYIQSMDQAAKTELTQEGTSEKDHSPWLNYLYTTLLIEERAGLFYPLYAPYLHTDGYSQVVQGIVKEEERHLAQMIQQLQKQDSRYEEKMQRLRPIENQAFSIWMNAVKTQILEKNLF